MTDYQNQFSGLGDGLPPKKRNVAKWEIFTGADGNYYFHLRANNGEIVCQSEGYSTKKSALKGIKSIRKNVESPIFEIVELNE